MTWFVVECLAPLTEPMTIVCKDGDPRDWTSIRSLHRHEFVDVDELLEAVRRNGNHHQQLVSARDGSSRLIDIDPIPGPEGETYGMHLWIGPASEQPTPHPPASAMSWHLGDLQVRLTEACWRMSLAPGDNNTHTSPTLSPAEFLRKAVRFDKINELVALAANPDPTATHASYSVILHDLGYLMNWYNIGRGRKDEHHNGMRGLTIDVTDTHPPVMGPLELLGLATGTNARNARPDSWATEPPVNDDNTVAALLASSPSVPIPVIAEWLTNAPSWIDWEREGDPVVFHPDDCGALRQTFDTLTNDEETNTPARIRAFTDTGWQPVTVTSRRYPGDVGDRLHIIRITKTDS
ncbi:GAF domain-containing protein [Nocardia brasiliensis]|uniref:GAF domain-containing protein n=1 Tax=Nocardia brasiliensis TaxID=37326 RepID=UPI0024559EC2|nr:GAF domain-containing protein [Nocardia brasiliensis]